MSDFAPCTDVRGIWEQYNATSTLPPKKKKRKEENEE